MGADILAETDALIRVVATQPSPIARVNRRRLERVLCGLLEEMGRLREERDRALVDLRMVVERDEQIVQDAREEERAAASEALRRWAEHGPWSLREAADLIEAGAHLEDRDAG